MFSRKFGVFFSSALLLVLFCVSLSMSGCGTTISSSDSSPVPASISGTVSGGSGEGIAITGIATDEVSGPIATRESYLSLSPNFVFTNIPNGTYIIYSTIPIDGNYERQPIRYDLVGIYKAGGWPYTWPPSLVTFEGASLSGLNFPLACYTSLEAYDSASSRLISGEVNSIITTQEIIVGVAATTDAATIGDTIVGAYVLPASAAGGSVYYYFFGLSDGDYIVFAYQNLVSAFGDLPAPGDMLGTTEVTISGDNPKVTMITLEVI